MKLSRPRKVLAAVAVVVLPVAATLAVGCHATTHAFTAADLGQARSTADLEAVVRIELPTSVAEAVLAEHDGLEVDYAVNLWSKRF